MWFRPRKHLVICFLWTHCLTLRAILILKLHKHICKNKAKTSRYRNVLEIHTGVVVYRNFDLRNYITCMCNFFKRIPYIFVVSKKFWFFRCCSTLDVNSAFLVWKVEFDWYPRDLIFHWFPNGLPNQIKELVVVYICRVIYYGRWSWC